jgi:hypothetical protein
MESGKNIYVSYVAYSHARVVQLRIVFLFIKKGTDSLKYLQSVSTIAYQLVMVDKPFAEEELLLYILGGLPF